MRASLKPEKFDGFYLDSVGGESEDSSSKSKGHLSGPRKQNGDFYRK
jgi:hypothetical protein